MGESVIRITSMYQPKGRGQKCGPLDGPSFWGRGGTGNHRPVQWVGGEATKLPFRVKRFICSQQTWLFTFVEFSKQLLLYAKKLVICWLSHMSLNFLLFSIFCGGRGLGELTNLLVMRRGKGGVKVTNHFPPKTGSIQRATLLTSALKEKQFDMCTFSQFGKKQDCLILN